MESDTTIRDRIRENLPGESNDKYDKKVKSRMAHYKSLTIDEINSRLRKLQGEWDIERALALNASSLALTGAIMGIATRRIWFFRPVVAAGFLILNSIRGWSPPTTILRSMGYRTRQEIDDEIFALKALRGDFD